MEEILKIIIPRNGQGSSSWRPPFVSTTSEVSGVASNIAEMDSLDAISE
jgi:hypothetical protein